MKSLLAIGLLLCVGCACNSIKHKSEQGKFEKKIKTVLLPSFEFKNSTYGDAVNKVRLTALHKLEQKSVPTGFSVILNIDSEKLYNERHSFILDSATIFDAFKMLGEMMEADVNYYNGIIYINSRIHTAM